MRIISPFRDYYDQHDYAESDDIYIRKSKEIIEDCSRSRNGINLDFIIIGFCGEIYPLIRAHKSALINGKNEITEEFCFSSKEYETIKLKESSSLFDNWYHPPSGFFSKDFSSHKEEFIKYGVPIFVKKINRYNDVILKFELNARLVDYKFGKIKDAQTAYQDVDMFISGVLGNKESMVEIDDKHRIKAHGYDEDSFRMPKGRKKPRRKNK